MLSLCTWVAYVQAASDGGLFLARKNERSFGRSKRQAEAVGACCLYAPYGMENDVFVRS